MPGLKPDLKLVSDLILWQALMRMKRNVLRIDHREPWANTTFQTLHENHVALLSRYVNGGICLCPPGARARLNHRVNLIHTEGSNLRHIVHGIRALEVAFNLESSTQHGTNNHAILPAPTSHTRLRHVAVRLLRHILGQRK